MASTAAAAEAWCFPASARVAANVVERRSGVGDVDASDADAQTIPVVPVLCGDKDSAERALRALPEAGRRWVAATQGVGGGQFSPKSGEVLLVPSASTGAIDRALLGVDSATDVWGFAALATKLPAAAPSPASADDQPPPAASPMRYELDGAALAALDEAAAAASGGGDGQRAGVISSAADAALLGFMLGETSATLCDGSCVDFVFCTQLPHPTTRNTIQRRLSHTQHPHKTTLSRLLPLRPLQILRRFAR